MLSRFFSIFWGGRMMDIWDEIAGESFNGFKYSKLFGRDPFKLMVLVFFGGDLYFQGQNWGNNYEYMADGGL